MIEKASSSKQILFHIWGVPFTGDTQSIGFPLGRLGIGITIAVIFWWGHPLLRILGIGIAYGILINMSLLLHILGHLIAGKWVGAPMDENFITPQLIETRYHENPADVPKYIHLTRTLGGVFTTLLIALCGAAVWHFTSSHWWLLIALFNLIIGVGITSPFNGVDGEVLWRELVKNSS